MRKIGMNLKLVIFSPWMRIVLMAALIGIGIRFYPKTSGIKYDLLLWKSIILVGIASLLFNDSGVVALGTCLAYGFTYRLLDVERLTVTKELQE
jgi:hypothetical protein